MWVRAMYRRCDGQSRKGFTLIELMIVIAIIGILAAIAIPQFSVYRAKGYNAVSRSDLKNAYTAAQAYFTDYPDGTFDAAVLSASGFQASRGVVLTIADGTQTGFNLIALNNDAGVAAITYTINASGTITP